MNLGFYYHVPLRCKESQYYLPGYLAVFVDALAREVKFLTLFLHEEKEDEIDDDTMLQERNINWINLGEKTPAWHRSFFFQKVLQPLATNIEGVDILLIRCPSPLAPYFQKVLKNNKVRVAYLVVGDYGVGATYWEIDNFRHWLIKHYLRWNDAALKKAVKGQLIFVNSAMLYQSLKQTTSNIHLIRTTTLTASDFWKRPDVTLRDPIKLAYVGRYDMHKGLKELINAGAILIKKGLNIELHFTGWEESTRKDVENQLTSMAESLDIGSSLYWHGRKRVGNELNQMYRDADIYLIPSYHEGFPRTIWEAMANSCPVIATKVGSIPDYLEHGKHAWLIEPNNVEAIAEAVEHLISDTNLRKKLSQNGYELAQEITLDIQTKKLVEIIKNEFKSS